MHQRLALFDLDGTLVDRQSAVSEAVAGLCGIHSFSAEVEQWMLTELADRANAADFARLREVFELDESVAQLWEAYVDRMAAAVICRPAFLEAWANSVPRSGLSASPRTAPPTSSAPRSPRPASPSWSTE
ncbi:HAD hydrolase-like protein [Streptomyces sp. HNM0663]|uniref:HAD hydrolase-like protein n=1 Tax=Streptomyces chengmaiensis TaxID=3040919 RepID=A0ABT6HW99_9ACTN|nr:HAD hydrolase-like protein [Streptomyces chengmaiensis]MDH2392996.1 HAD hydrolase-like protein [Streptomyces chengmaiensis]